MHWDSGQVTIALPGDRELEVRGFVHGEVAIAEHEGEWLVLHRRSGLIFGRFASQDLASGLGHRLAASVDQSLKRLPHSWAEGFWERLDEIRAETALENGLPPPPRLRRNG